MIRARFLEILAKHGVTLDTDNEDFDLNIDAPKGKVFAANGCHCIIEPWNNSGGQSWKSKAYSYAASRVEMGLRDCRTPDCDVCEEAENSLPN